MIRIFVTCCLLLAGWMLGSVGCGNGKAPSPDGGVMICPDHPANCGGTCCGSLCTDTQFDPKNCGSCNQPCDSDTLCLGGSCGCPTVTDMGRVGSVKCGLNETCCGAKIGCRNLTNDANNCGQCGHACSGGATCVSGECKCGGKTCQSGQVCCRGACSTDTACTPPPPDMAVNTNCQCHGCIFGCAAPPCCVEDIFSCTPDPNCP